MPNNPLFKSWLLWSIVLVAALGVRLGAAAWWQHRLGAPQAFAFGDSDSYWRLAEQVVEGEPFQYGGPEAKVMRMPGYPVLLSAAFLLWGGEPPVLVGRFVGALAGVVVVVGVMWLTQRRFGGHSGAVAGSIAALYPGGIATSVFILSEAAFCPLLILQACCWVSGLYTEDARTRLAWACAAGICSALAVYARPSWLLFPIFLTGCGLLCDRRRLREHLVVGGVAIALMGICLVPWWVRSYRFTGHFVVTTLEMGASLYDGLNPAADGGSNMDFKRAFYVQQEEDEPDATPGQFAYRVDRRMRNEAWRWAGENPGTAVRLAGVKIMRLWSPWPNAGQFRSVPMRLLVALGFLPLLFAVLIAAWRYREQQWTTIIVVLAPTAYISALHLVFVSSIRYRQPAMLLASVLAGGVVTEALSRYWTKRPPTSIEAP